MNINFQTLSENIFLLFIANKRLIIERKLRENGPVDEINLNVVTGSYIIDPE